MQICTLFITVVWCKCMYNVNYSVFTSWVNSNHFFYWKYPILKRHFVLFDGLRDDGLCQNDQNRNNNRHHMKYWMIEIKKSISMLLTDVVVCVGDKFEISATGLSYWRPVFNITLCSTGCASTIKNSQYQLYCIMILSPTFCDIEK